MSIVAHLHSTSCSNYGLPEAHFAVRVRQRAENRYQRETYLTLMFCTLECAAQTMFLRLETRTTRETVTRFFAGRPIRYAEFRRLVVLPQAGEASVRQNIHQPQQTIFDGHRRALLP